MYKKGSILYVMDGDWAYKSKVVNIKENKAQIHFYGYGKSLDEWIDMDSKRIVQESEVAPDRIVDG